MVECASRLNYLPFHCFVRSISEHHEKAAKGPVAVGGFADVYQVEVKVQLFAAIKKPRKAVLQKMKFVSFSAFLNFPNVFACSERCLKSLSLSTVRL